MDFGAVTSIGENIFVENSFLLNFLWNCNAASLHLCLTTRKEVQIKMTQSKV